MLVADIMRVIQGWKSFKSIIIAAVRPARVVNAASVGGLLTGPMIAPYSDSKFAVLSIRVALEAELRLAAAPVPVSLFTLGRVRTETFDMAMASVTDRGADLIDRTRLGGERGYRRRPRLYHSAIRSH